jgi:hypothetical protein
MALLAFWDANPISRGRSWKWPYDIENQCVHLPHDQLKYFKCTIKMTQKTYNKNACFFRPCASLTSNGDSNRRKSDPSDWRSRLGLGNHCYDFRE